ncbi:MAG: hypothetical protein HYY23_10850 [Verrucomicrobia bacterium]|nr:hypothetical protein [Verrucomicrobiota bacterium]
MNDFKFACPHCAQRLRVNERHAGRQILCPKCQHLITIPASSTQSLSGDRESAAPDATMAPELSIPPVEKKKTTDGCR